MNRHISRKRILIAEDEDAVRALMRDSILGDFDVVEACDGPQAIQLAEVCRPDAILLDLRMPSPGGMTVCRRFKTDPRLSRVPLIVTAALVERIGARLGLGQGADYYLPKPFTPQTLRQLLLVACSN